MATSGNSSDFIGFSSDLGRHLPIIHIPGHEELLTANEDLKLVLVGKIGVGKSSTGNILLDRDAFLSQRKATSVTTCADWKRSKVNGRSVLVIDTPGLYDTRTENCRQHVQNELQKCIELSAPGIHAIIFVLSTATRFTTEDKNSFEDFFEIFGERFFKYAVVVFTYADLLKEANITLKEYIGENITLKAFLNKCGNRTVAFNNKDPAPHEKETQRHHLISTVIEMNQSLKTYYTNQNFIDAELRLQKLEKQKEKNTKKRLDKLRQQLETKHAAELKELVEQYNKGIQELRDQIRIRIIEDKEQKEKDSQTDRCIVM